MFGVPLLLMAILLPVALQGNSTDVRDENPCMEGWFGQNCMYKCHCENNSVCGSDGSCPAGGNCHAGFFGPGCQYVNIAFERQKVGTPWYLYDNNVATCNPDTDAMYVEVSLTIPVPFYWIRIVVKDEDTRVQFSFKINNNADCYNERRFIVSNTIVDITCQTLNQLRSFSLIGRTAADVCEVYVSGAGPCTSRHFRLITLDALNQTLDSYETSGSSQLLRYDILMLHDKPVKGVNISMPIGSRSHCRILALCEVETFGETLCPDDTYGLWCNHKCDCNPGDECHIATGACAIACNSGFYGYNCTKPCPSRCINGTCYHRQGACVHCDRGHKGPFCDQGMFGQSFTSHRSCDPCGAPWHDDYRAPTDCAPGHFGMDCAWNCSNNCETPCDPASGACTCAKGFGGSRCDECLSGHYGEDCTKQCSVHCTNPCDQKTGHCFCDNSSFGLFCNECIAGMYGKNCTLTCPKHCQDKMCHKDTGHCLSCMGDHIGNYCEACHPKYYGHLCRFKCSAQCLNETCDDNNGTCSECLGNYGGPQCIIAPKDRSKIYWFIVPAMLPISMLVLSAIHFIRKKRETEHSEEDFSLTDSSKDSTSSDL